MGRIFASLIRMSAFVRKEIFEVLRQPRLLFSLVLGPFLILLIFGIGYRNEARALRTLFVVQDQSGLAREIEEYATTLGEQLIYMGVTPDPEAALNLLRQGEVDVVVVTPFDAEEQIRNSQQAVFILYHQEIDPFEADYVTYFGQIYIDEVNRRVLLQITQEGQADAETVRQDVAEARANAAALRQALEAGDDVTEREQRRELSGNLNSVSLAVGASLGLLSGVGETLGSGDGENEAAVLLDSLSSLRQDTDELGNEAGNGTAQAQRLERARRIETRLEDLETQLAEFTSISPNVLVRPFSSESRSIARLQPEATDYFVPAVIALLLQHLAITFAALSIVRERTVGTMELFRVSPLSAGETLLGKYISYLIFGAVITTLLTLLLIFGLGVPMLGHWWNYALVIAALLFTSLGIGFIISLLSLTDSQAVQLTMIVLLASVFFSGFLMRLEMIWEPVRVISWALPTTYGIVLLRDIMLRGNAPDPLLLGGLALIGLGLMIAAWLLLRRMIPAK